MYCFILQLIQSSHQKSQTITIIYWISPESFLDTCTRTCVYFTLVWENKDVKYKTRLSRQSFFLLAIDCVWMVVVKNIKIESLFYLLWKSDRMGQEHAAFRKKAGSKRYVVDEAFQASALFRRHYIKCSIMSCN